MHRIFIFISIVAILCAMALPAFALGDGDGTTLYAPIEFDSIFSNLDGGPYEWPFSSTNDNVTSTEVQAEFSVGALKGYTYVRNSNFGGMFNLAGGSFTLKLENKLVRVGEETLDISVSNTEFIIVRVYGSYVTIEPRGDGTYTTLEHEFDRNFYIERDGVVGAGFNTLDLLRQTIDGMEGYEEVMLFSSLKYDFSVSAPVNNETPCFWVYMPRTSMSTIKYPVTQWITNHVQDVIEMPSTPSTPSEPSEPSDTIEFNLGSWLGECLGGFLDFEIYKEFTLGHVLYGVIVVGIVFWFLKIVS